LRFSLCSGGIFNSDGEAWRATRKTASHMFSAAKLNLFMLESFIKHAQTLSTILEAQRVKQDRSKATPCYIDMQTQFLRYTMDAICEIGFGLELGGLKNESEPPFAAAFDRVQEASLWRLLGPPFKYKIQRFFRCRSEKVIAENIPILDDFVYSIIQTRKANAEMYQDAGDLLSLFLADGKSNHDMTDKELRDLILNFMIAGKSTQSKRQVPTTMLRLLLIPLLLDHCYLAYVC
jgi:cytochrome P450